MFVLHLRVMGMPSGSNFVIITYQVGILEVGVISMKSGIYLIRNIINDKEYIGSSKNLQKRKYSHWEQLRKGRHKNPHLQNAWSIYGENSFVFLILGYCAV